MELLAIIPARGGSKGIPDKNIQALGSKPLIAWTIKAALSAKGIGRVVVSTDSPRIADVAKEFGVEVPFQRPPALARDDTPGIDVILHAVRWLRDQEGYQPDFLVYLQPTSPFRTADDIDQALNLASQANADAVVSVAPLGHHPNWMQVMDECGRLRDYIPGGSSIASRQEMPPVFELNGAIYLIRTGVLLAQGTLFPENTYGYVMPRERSIDIDSPWDLYLADLIAKDKYANDQDR